MQISFLISNKNPSNVAKDYIEKTVAPAHIINNEIALGKVHEFFIAIQNKLRYGQFHVINKKLLLQKNRLGQTFIPITLRYEKRPWETNEGP